jgi:hypothetical protein
MDDWNGVDVGALVLCERVDREDDGRVTLVGVHQQIILRPDEVLPISRQVGIYFALRHRAVGRQVTVSLRLHHPMGEAQRLQPTLIKLANDRLEEARAFNASFDLKDTGHHVIDLVSDADVILAWAAFGVSRSQAGSGAN